MKQTAAAINQLWFFVTNWRSVRSWESIFFPFSQVKKLINESKINPIWIYIYSFVSLNSPVFSPRRITWRGYIGWCVPIDCPQFVLKKSSFTTSSKMTQFLCLPFRKGVSAGITFCKWNWIIRAYRSKNHIMQIMARSLVDLFLSGFFTRAQHWIEK